MGTKFFDQFSYLHFSVGIMTYFWDISIVKLIIIHTIYEIIENTNLAMNFINKYIKYWPGGKSYSDKIINIIGDTFFALLGWISAYYLDKLGNKYGWYSLHIQS